MKKFLHINVFLALSGIFSFSNADENERFVYPQAKSDQVNDYFGTKIADPLPAAGRRRFRSNKKVDRSGEHGQFRSFLEKISS